MAKQSSFIDRFVEWKRKQQQQETQQEAQQEEFTYTAPKGGTIADRYEAYQQQRQAYEQKQTMASGTRMANVQLNAFQRIQSKNQQGQAAEARKKAQEAALEEAAAQKKQQEHVDFIGLLRQRYMPDASKPPQVELRKYEPLVPQQEPAKPAEQKASDAALAAAEYDRRERDERDRSDREAREALLERLKTEGEGGALPDNAKAWASDAVSDAPAGAAKISAAEQITKWESDLERIRKMRDDELSTYGQTERWQSLSKTIDDVKKAIADKQKEVGAQQEQIFGKPEPTAAGRGGGLTAETQAEPSIPMSKSWDRMRELAEGLKQPDAARAQEPQEAKPELSLEELQANREQILADIVRYDAASKTNKVGMQDVEGQQNKANSAAMKAQAEKALEDVDQKIQAQQDAALVKELQEKYDVAPEAEKGMALAALSAAKAKQAWSNSNTGEKVAVWLGDRAKQGILMFNKGYYAIGDLALQLFGMEPSKLSKDNQKALDEVRQNISNQAERTSALTHLGGEVVSSAIRTIPSTIIAILTGGQSMQAEAIAAMSAAGQPLNIQVGQEVLRMLRNPSFINSALDSFGNSYAEEVEKGNDMITSVVHGVMKAVPDAMIEVGGGIETAASKPRGLATILETAKEEGMEEFWQGIAGRAYDYSQSGKGADTALDDIVSWDNPEAIISGKQMIEETAMGAATGGLMGGVQQGVFSAVDSVLGPSQQGQEYNYDQAPKNALPLQTAQAIQTVASTLPEGSKARQLADDPQAPTGEVFRATLDAVGEDYKQVLIDSVAQGVEEQLREMGEQGDTAKVAKAITEVYGGAKINPETRKTLVESENGMGLLNSMLDSDAQMEAEQEQKIEAEPSGDMLDKAREYGLAGIRLNDLYKTIGEENVNDEVKKAYDEGAQQAKSIAAEREQEVKAQGAQADRKGVLRSISAQEAQDNGVEQVGKITPLVRSATNALRGFAEDTGLNVVLFESPVNDKGQHIGKQGWYDRNTQTIYLDVKSGYGNEEAIMRAAGHEITHFIKQYAPDYYENNYKQNVIDALYDGDPDALMRMVEDQIRKAKENGITQTESQAMDEVIADASETMLFGGQATLTKLVNENPKLFVRVKNWIDNFVKALQRAVHNIMADSEGAKLLTKSYDRFKQVQSNWWNALQEASVNLRGEIQAEAKSAYEEARARTQEAKNEKIGTAVSVPGANQYVRPADVSPVASKPGKPKIDFEAAINPDLDLSNLPQEALDIVMQMGEKPAKKPTAKGKTSGDPLSALNPKTRRLVRKWMGNEYVNIDPVKNPAGAQDFAKFAEKWYNAGRGGLLPFAAPENNIDKTKKHVTFDDNDLNYPPFLQDVFYNQGKEDAGAAAQTNKEDIKDAREEISQQGRVTESAGELSEGREGEAGRPVSTDGARQEAGGILENVSSQNVQRDGGRGNVAQEASEQGPESAQYDDTTDSERAGREPGVGAGLRGDSQPEAGERGTGELLGVTGSDSEPASQAHEAVEEARHEVEVSAHSGQNYIIPPEGLELPSGKKARFNANIDAIKIAKQLEEEGRIATPQEQEVLSRYVGWGGIADAFDERSSARAEWGKENDLLKGLLTEDEYKAARASTKNAHYTSVEVIRSMYDALSSWGFKGGYILEPSVGVGNFIGSAPAFQKASKWAAVELDHITSLIAKHLYPQARVHNMGFQEARFPDNYFDLAIGNVPFGNYGVVDKTYPNYLTKSIHNYFFAKAIDKVRPGGVLLFITSKYTMDSDGEGVREYLQTKADLLGAVRLPDSAFKENADTNVVTDILVLKKREAGTPYGGEAFTSTHHEYVRNPFDQYGRISHTQNEYFVNHPEMVLGEAVPVRGMYRQEIGYKQKGDTPLEQQIKDALAKIPYKMEYPARSSVDAIRTAVSAVRAASGTKNNGLEIKDGKVYKNQNGELKEVDTVKSTADVKKIQDMLGIRDIKNKLISAQLQGMSRQTIDGLRKKLNSQYDAFVKKNGYLNDPSNVKLMQDDPDSYSISALEVYKAKEGKKPASATKSDIFTKDTVARVEKATKAQTPQEALVVTINETGYVDAQRIGELLGISEEKARAELIRKRLAFKDRSGALVQAEKYLTGKVRAKLDEAKALAAVDDSYLANVEALEEVIPVDIPAKDIAINLGAAWVPTEVYEAFARHILQTPYSGELKVNRLKMTNAYSTKVDERFKRTASVYNERTWGAGGWSFLKIFDKIMNGSSMQVVRSEKAGDETIKTVDREATAAVNAKVEEINTAFINWLASHDDLNNSLARLYNDTFNDLVEPRYNGDNLTIEGSNPMLPLKKHQKDVIQRAIQQGGNLLIAHGVGAGKTAEMAGIAMKMRQLGIVRKPMFVVPKSVTAQWGGEFNKFFPSAKLLVPSESDYGTSGRKTYINKIVANDYDAIIMSYEMFESIPLSPAAQKAFFSEQMDEALDALKEMKAEKDAESTGYSRRGSGKTDHSVKQMEKYIEQIKVRIEKLDAKNARDVDNVDFETLGVDGLFVDEAHNFKNLRVSTHLQNVSGINTGSESGRAFDLLSKVRYLQGVNDGRGIVFATATPVMNTMGELFVMQKYLAPELMKDRGVYNFDAWAKQFGRVTNELQLNTTGTGYNVKSILSRYNNLPELQTLTRSWADIITKVEGLKVPEIKGGAPVIHEIEPSEFQIAYVKELAERAEALRGKKVEKGSDNMLVITNNGRDIALSQKMIDTSLPVEQGGKMDTVAGAVFDIWKAEAANKGTQLIFLDRGTPSNAADMYSQIKQLLMAKGIPAGEIKSIYDAANDKEKLRLFEQVNNGDVRVLIGSTATMGTGVNVQQRVAAMHHVDVPWRPGDLTQRDGRGIRQGNTYADLGGVGMHYYVTKKTFDAYMWQKIQTKATFINQIMSGTNTMRESEGEGMELTAAEVTAIASGNPMVKEKFALEKDIDRLVAQKKQHDKDRKDNLTRKAHNEGAATDARRRAALLEREIPNRQDTSGDKFKMTINGKTFTEREKAGAKLISDYLALNPTVPVNIGSVGGMTLRALPMHYLSIGDIASLSVEINLQSASGTIARIENAINGMEAAVEKLTANADRLDQENQELTELVKKRFDKQEELDQKSARYAEIMRELAPSANESADVSDSSESDDIDYSLRRITSPDFLEREDDIGKAEDRAILIGSLEASDRDPSRLSAREQLATAFETISHTNVDKEIIAQYKNKLEKVEADVTALREINAKIRELSFASGPRNMDELAKLKNNKVTLSNRIARADSMLTRIENAQPMKQLISREKRKADSAVKRLEALSKRYERKADTQERNKLKESIVDNVTTMRGWIAAPNVKAGNYVPDLLMKPLSQLLEAVNAQSKRALNGGERTIADKKFVEGLEAMQRRLEDYNASVNREGGAVDFYLDLPSNITEAMRGLIDVTRGMLDKGDTYIINQMSNEQLGVLDDTLTSLRTSIRNINATYTNQTHQRVSEAAEIGIDELSGLVKKGRNSTTMRFINWMNTTPVNAFDRLGSVATSFYSALQDGADKLSFLVASEEAFSEKTFTGKEARAWADEIKTFTIGGREVQMPVTSVMSLYSLAKREQAMGHIMGAGIRIANFKRGAQTIQQAPIVVNATNLLAQVENALTDRQKAVADALQKRMSTAGADLGNEVSMKRFGTRMFTEQNYFPIETDSTEHANPRDDDSGRKSTMFSLLNMSATKELTKNANNRLVVRNVFDVYANHMTDMMRYNSMALPILDMIKWYNYRQMQKDESGTVLGVRSTKAALTDSFGRGAVSYVHRLLENANGPDKLSPADTIGNKFLGKYNKAVISANLRVALLQPTSFAKAAMVLNPLSMGTGLIKNIAHLKQNIAEMEANSGIALWKQMGFYDLNISNTVQELLKRDSSVTERVVDKGMWLPGTMDRLTWGALWQATKDDVNRSNPTLKGDAYMGEVKRRFRDMIYRTQVVDSVLTRSEFMRQSSFAAKNFSSFMSEGTQAYNLATAAVHKLTDEVNRGTGVAAAWKKHGAFVARSVAVYVATAAASAIVEAISDAYRDDEEFEPFMDKIAEGFKKNFFNNLLPNIPIVSNIIEAAKRFLDKAGFDTYGFEEQDVLTAGLDYFTDALERYQKQNDNGYGYQTYGWVYKALQGASSVTGLPMANMTRELVDAWNMYAKTADPQHVIKTYNSKGDAYDHLYEAIQAGDKERVAKVEALIRARGDTEKDMDTGYWSARGRATGENKYDMLEGAVRTGKDLKTVVQEYFEYGVTKQTLGGQITTLFKPEYVALVKSGKKAEAAKLKGYLLNAYVVIGYKREDKNKDIDAWLKEK